MVGLTKEQKEFYQENGYLAPVRIMSTEDAGRLRSLYENTFDPDNVATILKDVGFDPNEVDLRQSSPHLFYKWVAELMYQPKLVGAVRDILGADVVVWLTEFFVKEARSSNFISWHQDLKYWRLDMRFEEVTAWVALSASTPESGCMRVLPGSHKLDLVDHRDTFSDKNMLSRGQEIAVDVNEDETVDLVLQPGEMSLHHGKIFHASHANKSNDKRIGFVVRCLPSAARQTFGKGIASHLCGAYDDKNFDLLPAADDNAPSAQLFSDILRRIERFDEQMETAEDV